MSTWKVSFYSRNGELVEVAVSGPIVASICHLASGKFLVSVTDTRGLNGGEFLAGEFDTLERARFVCERELK